MDPQVSLAVRCSAPCAISAARVLAATAISAVDVALYDLKASLLDLPLATLLGAYRDSCSDLRQRRLHHLFRRRTAEPTLGLGGARRLSLRQDENWNQSRRRSATRHASPRRRSGMRRSLSTPMAPTRSSRLYACGRVSRKQNVAWFEEPVSSDDLRGLRAGPPAGAGRDGHRRRRICLYDRLCARECLTPMRSTSSKPT